MMKSKHTPIVCLKTLCTRKKIINGISFAKLTFAHCNSPKKMLKNHYISELKTLRPNCNTLPSNGVAKIENGTVHPLYRFRSESIHHAHLVLVRPLRFITTQNSQKKNEKSSIRHNAIELSSLCVKNCMFSLTSSLPGSCFCTA